MGCCEHGNEHLGFQNKENCLTSSRNISFLEELRSTQSVSCLLQQQAVYPQTTNCITVL